MVDLQARQKTQLNRLAGERKCAGNHSLTGNDRSRRCQYDHRYQRPFGHAHEKRIFNGGRIAQQQRALPDIIQCQSRQHQREPGGLYGFAAEVAHVGIQRFRAGYCQHHRTEAYETHPAVVRRKIKPVIRVNGTQNIRILHNLIHPGSGQRTEPEQHHRPEKRTDMLRALALHIKQHRNHRQRNRQNPMLQLRVEHSQTFHGGKHGYCGRNHRIAEKHRRTGQPQQQHEFRPFARKLIHRLLHQHHHAALAFIVGMQDKHHIFERNHQNQCPDDQRHKSQDAAFPHPHMRSQKRLLQRIERAGADIAVNNAQSRQNHGSGRLVFHEMPVLNHHNCAKCTPLGKENKLLLCFQTGMKRIKYAFQTFLEMKKIP